MPYPKFYHGTKTMGVELYPSEKLYLAKLNNKLIKQQKEKHGKENTTLPTVP